jgi:S-formylglutathione hydrolase FrmB
VSRSTHHGVSLLGGWLPAVVQIVAVLAVIAVIGWRSRRWRLVWVPVSVAIGAAGALATRTWVNSEGLASDPAPVQLWLWATVFVSLVAIAVLGWRSAGWRRRALSVVAVPLTLLAVLITLNQWVGYYPTVPAAWNALTAGPLPDEVDAEALPSLRDTTPSTGKLIEVTIPDTASGFNHRSEYVYLPPRWFAGPTPPMLPTVMMIAGEFNTAADWMRSGGVIPMIDDYARAHGGWSPIFVFVDAGGRFNNDTECVDGPRGQAADHLTRDVRPYVVDQFGASADPAAWGVVGWSMGGTCAVDLTVMHPELFHTFVDIAGDHGPTAGTKDQTVDRLYGGDLAAWQHYDPATVMRTHGPYRDGVAGWFAEAVRPPADQLNSLFGGHSPRAQSTAPLGFGGHDVFSDEDQANAGRDLCAIATTVGIECTLHSSVSMHTWQFAAGAFGQALPWLGDRLAAAVPAAAG